jgi:hypothetical protein
MITDQVRPRWFIDFDWYQQSNRSFFTLVQNYLCPKCRERPEAGGAEIPASELLSTIRDCCSKTPGFITSKSPILESVFRLFLANGNQPLNLEELGRQLSEQSGGYTHHASAEILSRLLSHDQYYGLRQVPESVS